MLQITHAIRFIYRAREDSKWWVNKILLKWKLRDYTKNSEEEVVIDNTKVAAKEEYENMIIELK